MKSFAVQFRERKSIAAAMTEEEDLGLELKMLNLARLRAKIKLSLRNNENREFLLKHL